MDATRLSSAAALFMGAALLSFGFAYLIDQILLLLVAGVAYVVGLLFFLAYATRVLYDLLNDTPPPGNDPSGQV